MRDQRLTSHGASATLAATGALPAGTATVPASPSGGTLAGISATSPSSWRRFTRYTRCRSDARKKLRRIPLQTRALTVLDVRLALSDLDNITVRIADVAARLAVLVLWLRDELCS